MHMKEEVLKRDGSGVKGKDVGKGHGNDQCM